MADRGAFVWFDLMTGDVEGAKAFYGSVVGWETTSWGGGDSPYTMWQAGEASVGGIMEMPEDVRAQGVPPHWIAYVEVPDVDAASARAEELGGRVMHAPTDIPEVGRFSVITDPQGAAIALFTPDTPGSMTMMKGPGHFTWFELTTTDHEAAWRFYAELAGWRHERSFDMGEMGEYRLFAAGEGEAIGGMWTRPEGNPVPPSWLYYISVSDLDGALERVKAGGGQVLNGPMEVPGGDRVAQCLDPQGGAFALHEPKGA